MRILVVDDNEDGAEMLAAVLSDKGYDTRVAHDAPDALRRSSQRRRDSRSRFYGTGFR